VKIFEIRILESKPEIGAVPPPYAPKGNMKYRNKVKKLAKRQRAFDNTKDTRGMTRPGSVNK